jgi:hypothetical protein
MNFREYTSNDLEQVVDLLNECLKRKTKHKITKESFEWKHFDKFFGGQTLAFVAEVETQIVSFVCFTPMLLSNQEIIWNCSIQATDERFRRQGIVTKLTKMCEQNIQQITQKSQNGFIGFSNDSGINIDKNSKSIGYKILGQFRQLKIFPNPVNLIFKIFSGSNENNLCSNKNNASKTFLTWSKNKAYLEWKYENNPKQIFVKLQLGNCEIYLKKSIFTIEIYDLINFNGLSIWSIIVYIQKEYPMNMITIRYLNNHSIKSIFNLQTPLCFDKKIPLYLTVSSLNEELSDVNNWLLFGGDIV